MEIRNIDILCLQELRGPPDETIINRQKKYHMLYETLNNACSEGMGVVYDKTKFSVTWQTSFSYLMIVSFKLNDSDYEFTVCNVY